MNLNPPNDNRIPSLLEGGVVAWKFCRECHVPTTDFHDGDLCYSCWAGIEIARLREAIKGPYTDTSIAADLRNFSRLLEVYKDAHGTKTYGPWIDWMRQVADGFDAALAREPGEREG